MGLMLGGNADTIVTPGDPRTREQRLGAGAMYLNRVVQLMRDIIGREAVMNKMWAWLDANEGHEMHWQREKTAMARAEAIWSLLADLSDAASRLDAELATWPQQEREQWVGNFQVPQPMTWRVEPYDMSIDTTPWKDYCPF